MKLRRRDRLDTTKAILIGLGAVAVAVAIQFAFAAPGWLLFGGS
jgi:hypothetical protein